MPGMFANFIAGRQAGQAEQQQQFQNQFAMRQQAMAEQELAQKEAALADNRRFNQLLAGSFGQDTVDTLGVPLTGGAPAQASMQSQMAQQPIDESQGPPQYPQTQPPQSPAPFPSLGSNAPLPLSQLIAIDPERALKAEEARREQVKQQQTTIYNVTSKVLGGKGSRATALKYLLSADNIGGLPIKPFREALKKQGFDVENPTEEAATQLVTSLRDNAASIILPPAKAESTDDIREYERAKSEGYPGTFAEYMVEMKRAGAANTNVNLPANKYPNKFQEGLAESDVRRLEKYQQQAEGATEMVKTLDRLQELSTTALAGGQAEKRAEIANWIQGFTGIDVIDPKILADTQNYNSLVTKAVIDRLGGSLGTGVSNTDVAFIKETVPKLEQSRAAREGLIAYLRQRAGEQAELYDRAREYGERTGGLKGFDSAATQLKEKTKAKAAKRDYSKVSDADLSKELGL